MWQVFSCLSRESLNACQAKDLEDYQLILSMASLLSDIWKAFQVGFKEIDFAFDKWQLSPIYRSSSHSINYIFCFLFVNKHWYALRAEQLPLFHTKNKSRNTYKGFWPFFEKPGAITTPHSHVHSAAGRKKNSSQLLWQSYIWQSTLFNPDEKLN